MLDAHGSTGVTEAIKLAREVEQYDIAWYEEPVIYHNFPGMAEVRRATSIPIATGEDLYGRHAFRDLGLARAADIWQPDTAMAGGHHRDGADRRPGLGDGGPARAALLGQRLPLGGQPAARRRPTELLHLRVRSAYSPLLYELVTTPVKVAKDGYVEIPTGPGLGVELVPDAEQRFPFEYGKAEHRPLV